MIGGDEKEMRSCKVRIWVQQGQRKSHREGRGQKPGVQAARLSKTIIILLIHK